MNGIRVVARKRLTQLTYYLSLPILNIRVMEVLGPETLAQKSDFRLNYTRFQLRSVSYKLVGA